MEEIIKKAIEGGWGIPKHVTILEMDADHAAAGKFFVKFYGTETDTFSYNTYQVLMDDLFWQALSKACGWKENYFYTVVCAHGEGREYWFGSDCKNELPEWLEKSMIFHELNLTKGFDAAVEWLEDLIKKEV